VIEFATAKWFFENHFISQLNIERKDCNVKTQRRNSDSGCIGTVRRFHGIGTDDPCAFATVVGYTGDVSFSLAQHRNVWQSEAFPELGAQVILFNIQRINGKWRALQARLYGPDDEGKQ